jgi:PadR family transcriptional regulator, regulatory protein PadR
MQADLLYGCRMTARRLRVTMVILDILDVLINASHDDPAWGLQICEQTGYGTGTVYPALDRLLRAGWIEDRWEDPPPSDRPRRRYYLITSVGRAAYDEAEAARSARRRKWARPVAQRAGGTA